MPARKHRLKRYSCLTALTSVALTFPDTLAAQDRLEEIIVTADRREKPLQDTPIAVSVLTDDQLAMLGISSLDSFGEGIIPSLKVQPIGNTPSTLIIAVRGNGVSDATQITREAPVAIYRDGFYMGRTQGLSMDLADLERIEVLRGPQGTLFGRNATGGAINVVSKKPTGTLGIRQTVGYGNYDALRSVTTLNLPEFSGISLKLDYIHSEREGWVDNTAEDQADYNAYNKDGGRLSLNWQLSDAFSLDYSYERTNVVASQVYFQLQEDAIGIVGVEDGRAEETRFPVTPLEPSETDHEMHTLSLDWTVSDHLTVRSLTAYREMEEDTNNNYAGTLYFNGVIIEEEFEQDQFSQEFQLIGTHDRFEWIAGLYHFEEDAAQTSQNKFSLDVFGFITGAPLTPIPLTTFDVFSGADAPLLSADTKANSQAIYGQATWTPPVLDDQLELTVGLRYTDDERDGGRTLVTASEFNLNTDSVDPLFVLNYRWSDRVSTYAKYSTAYRAGGASIRSASFASYSQEDVETFEIGLKSEFWNQRARLNVAAFTTDFKGAQLDITDPINPTISEIINASNTVEVDGLEMEFTAVPVPGLVIGINYTYLDGTMPLQPNPLAGGGLQQFNLVQTPEHAGSFTLDYTFAPFEFGTLSAHVDITATDEYAYIGSGTMDLDAYALVNARLNLADISLGSHTGSLNLSLWGKNLTDEEYIVYGVPLTGVGAVQVFGTPRTYGLDFTYRF